METEVYSWRVSSQLKSTLEQAARKRKTTVADALRQAATQWINQDRTGDDEAEQRRLHLAAQQTFGTLSGLPPAENAAQAVKEKLRRRYAR